MLSQDFHDLPLSSYNPVHELVKRTIASGKIGNGEYDYRSEEGVRLIQSPVLSVHFEWLLDTVHGADYFRRWHRQKTNSGGLMVHKSGHHFDLVNWWLSSTPETVAAMGRLAFYGAENGKRHGWAKDYERARGTEAARDDPFAIDLDGDETLKSIYADAEVEDGYHRDQNVSRKYLTRYSINTPRRSSRLESGSRTTWHCLSGTAAEPL